jgi:type 2 lantibiotic biosynthesis protein LanM
MLRVDASWNGATLAERLAHLRRSGTGSAMASGDHEVAAARWESLLAPWARASALGDRDAFLRRLSWDGIDVAVAAAAMAATAPDDFPVAPWVERQSELVAEASVCAPAVDTPAWHEALTGAAIAAPFVDAWVPVLRVARRHLTAAVPQYREWLSNESIAALEAALVNELARLGELALLGDFRAQTETRTEGSSAGYWSYIRHLLASRYDEFFATFPVLTRQVILLADQWVEQSAVLVSRLLDDRSAIESTFDRAAGAASRVTPGLSDRHAGGCRVTFVEFASGLRLAYKPRDVRLERVFNEWLVWLRESGLTVVPRPLRVVDRGTHGWVGWIEQEDLDCREAVQSYFRSAGALVCLAHLLGATDLHSENLIASADGPVLVDTEMLLQPSTRISAVVDGDAVGSSVDSCLVSGLVSLIVVDTRGKAFDVGGLQAAADRELAVPMRRWINLRRDDIGYVAQHRVHPALRNDVRIKGQVQRPEDFVDDLCAGFASTYRFLESHRAALLAADGPLSAFADCRARVLFRPSDQYAAALYMLAAPRYQRRGLDRSLAIAMFDRAYLRDTAPPRLWPLVYEERQSLEALDIPRITLPASATDLEAASGAAVRSFYAQSGVEAMRSRLSALSADDLASQLDQLRTALGGHDAASLAARGDADQAAGQGVEQAGLRAAAERVGHALLARAHQHPDGSLRWSSSGGRTDLYSGASGMGLFFAALAAVTGRGIWADAAQAILRGIEADRREAPTAEAGRIGVCSGPLSVAYAVALAGQLLEDERIVAGARALALTMPFDAIDTDPLLDIEGGAAGALVALLAVHDVSPDDGLLAIAGRCVSRLVATQIRTGADRGGWPAGEDATARPGFAHGAAGIAYALGRWATHSGDCGVGDVVRDAWGFERRIFADHNSTWPAVRRDGGGVVMAAWCHGAPGIALARALAPIEIADRSVAGEIDAAMQQTLAAPESQLDHLCCGNLGRADIALTVGLRTGAPHWVDCGLNMTRAVAARILSQGRLGMRARGFHWGAPVPEFFQGLAGIGYQLLRTSSPAVVPSVLAFERPAVSRHHPILRSEDR